MKIDGVKVFCATTPWQWQQIDGQVTDWIRAAGVEPVDIVVRQSSDDSHHCLSVTVFYSDRASKVRS